MTRANAHLYLPLVQALSEGKVLQARTGGIYADLAEDIVFCDAPGRYRIKPEPAPPLPLELTDIAPGCAIRHTGIATFWSLINYANINQVWAGCDEEPLSYARLAADYEIRRPGGEWEPCWKLEGGAE